ncbi:MAG TPA: calcium/sodium antiporter [Acidobacteriota bacterium]|nr:calcium/sodium antiporter [Acidobacteriota bacterium]
MEAWSVVFFLLGLLLLLGGAELLVRGSSRLAAALGISPLIIGLTVVAFGTSSPELAVSMRGAWTGHADLSVGNVLGSNIFNVLFILGLSALIVPLKVDQRLVRIDVPLMTGASLLLLVMAWDGRLGRLEGGILSSGLLAYIAFAVWQSRRESKKVKAEYAQQFGPPPPTASGALLQIAVAAVGLLLLLVGAQWLLDGSIRIARWAGLSELTIGLTIIAAGTSLPEVATSLIAALRGERDIAVGNVVGSNLFNLLGVLGPTAVLAPGGLQVAPSALLLDLPFVVATALVCTPIFLTAWQIDRWEGGALLLLYLAYVAALLASDGDASNLGYVRYLLIAAPALLAGASLAPSVRARRR